MTATRRFEWVLTGAAFLGILMAALPLAGQPGQESPQDPLTTPEGRAVLGRGFDPTKLYDAEDVDTVNLFSGSLSLQIPIGPELPQNAGGSFGLSLGYTSSVWDFEGFFADQITWCNLATGICGPEEDPPNPCEEYTQKWPSWTFNAGLGWRVSLGELFAPGRPDLGVDDQEIPGVFLNEGLEAKWRYIGPDGSSHDFLADLHIQPGGGPLYTNDGSYMRLTCFDGSPGCNDRPVIEMPDGSRHVFENDPNHPGAPGRAYRLRSIEDPFGNVIFVGYSADGLTWNIIDQHDRVVRVFFEETSSPTEPPGTFGGRFLKRILVAGVNGPIEYEFEYTHDTLPPGCSESYPYGETGAFPPGEPVPELKLALLERIILPDGSTYEFDYQPGGTPPGLDSCTADVLIRAAKLPTHGRIEWDWELWDMNHANMCPEDPDPVPQGGEPSCENFRVHPSWRVAAVAERRVYRPSFEPGPALQGTWTYDQEINLLAVSDCLFPDDDPLFTKTTVFDPLGHKKVHYFSAFTHADPLSTFHEDGWTRAEYGLPFTRSESKQFEGEEYFLSTETYECGGIGNPSCNGAGQTDCRVLQKTYVRYQHDAERDTFYENACNRPNQTQPHSATCRNLNPVLVARASEHYDASSIPSSLSRYSGVKYSSFDGVGNFRRAEAFADFCANMSPERSQSCRGDRRIEFTSYNPSLGVFDWIPGDDWTVPGTSERWLWTLYDDREIREPSFDGAGDLVNKRLYDFDGQNGFLRSMRTIADNRPPIDTASHDLLVEYTMEPGTGNVAAETYSGGDRVPIPQGPQYEVRHEYVDGVLESSHMVEPPGCDPGTPGSCTRTLLLEQNVIESELGLVTRSEGPTGLGIDYGYDALSRLATIDPDGELASTISYETGSNNVAASVTIGRGSGSARTERTVEFDGFGRVLRDLELRFDGSSSEVEKSYWAGGLLASESVRGPSGGQLSKTSYVCYDPLGRVRQVRYPDHVPDQESHKTVFRWFGPHVRQATTSNVARERNGETAFVDEKRTERYDALGRLWGVIEFSAGPSDDNANLRETLYRRDLEDRLVRVKAYHDFNASCSTACQEREFVYDGRGFLLEERHPELTGSDVLPGNFDVLYGLYDARGNPGRRDDGRTLLEYDYDFAGRLIRASAGGSPVVEYFYADENRTASGFGWAPSGADKTAGRLFQARRHQWLSRTQGGATEPVSVTETYGYQGVGGRLSEYSVRSFSPSSEEPSGYSSLRFTAGLDYDGFGRISRITYPECDQADTQRCPAADPGRTVENLYTRGWLTGVRQPGVGPFASSISYHPSGLPHEIAHGNGVKTVQEADPDGFPRPLSIATQGITSAEGDWQSGDFSYDTLGNVYRIGTGATADEFLYDDVNRVVEGRLRSAGPLKVERYTYDVFGNLLSIEDDSDTDPGNGVDRTLDLMVDPETNRLLSPQALYDPSGNVTQAGFLNLNGTDWDPLNRLTAVYGNGLNRQFLYSAFGERLAVIDSAPSGCLGCTRETWTVRGPGAKVLREHTRTLDPGAGSDWTHKDYVYRGGTLLASVTGAGETRYFHLDHLGSPRVISDDSGARTAFHLYYPFGREATPRGQDDERMKFTGHERDFQTELGGSLDDEADDLDYMHARYYSPWIGRFLSVDPVLGEAEAAQSWNRYSYARNSPLVLVDPSGLDPLDSQVRREARRKIRVTGEALTFSRIAKSPLAPAAKKVLLALGTGLRIGSYLEQGLSKIGVGFFNQNPYKRSLPDKIAFQIDPDHLEKTSLTAPVERPRSPMKAPEAGAAQGAGEGGASDGGSQSSQETSDSSAGEVNKPESPEDAKGKGRVETPAEDEDEED